MQAANNPLAVTFFFVFMALTLGITYWAARRTRTTEQFFAAGGQITAWQNGWALAGDESLKSAPHYAPRRRLDETLAARKPVLTWQGHVQPPGTPSLSEIGGS